MTASGPSTQLLTINTAQGRITSPTNSNLIPIREAGSTEGFTPSGSITLTSFASNNETYVKGSSSEGGVYPIKTSRGDYYPVTGNESYLFTVQGYQTALANVTWNNKVNVIVDISNALTENPTLTIR